MAEEIEWDQEADDWVEWARSPGHDAYWQYRDALRYHIHNVKMRTVPTVKTYWRAPLTGRLSNLSAIQKRVLQLADQG
jgi:hypothetical protein